MAPKKGPLKRIARGVFGPSKKTLLKVAKGISRQQETAVLEGIDIISNSELKTAKEVLNSLTKFTANLVSVSKTLSDKNNNVMHRICVKYTLDAMNITGEKRKMVFQIMEKCRKHANLRNGNPAPIFVNELIKELGPTKTKIFVKMLLLKNRQMKKGLKKALSNPTRVVFSK